MVSWIVVIAAALVQESIFLTSSLLFSLNNNLSLVLTVSIFLLATALDIWLGWRIGKIVQLHFPRSRWQLFLKHKIWELGDLIGQRGKRYVLTLLGIISLPYINSFFASWLDLSFWPVFFYTFIGDLISYILLWAIIFGVDSFALNFYISVIIIVFILSIFAGLVRRRMKKRRRS